MITNNKLDDSARTDSKSFLKGLWVTVCDDCDCGLKSLSDLKAPIICKRVRKFYDNEIST
jgi:hypothetical protein